MYVYLRGTLKTLQHSIFDLYLLRLHSIILSYLSADLIGTGFFFILFLSEFDLHGYLSIRGETELNPNISRNVDKFI